MATVRTDAYQLPLPAGWSDRTAVTIVAPAAVDGSVPNLVITREALCSGMGLAGFAEGHANLMRDQVDAFELRSNGWEELDGERALVRVVRFQVADSAPLVQLQAFLVRDGLGYAICGTASEAAYADSEPAFRAVLDGLHFTAPASPEAAALQVLRG
ncbi:MAG TPA: DcrB-related protein [Gaiellales bacterium]|nr:DcrB-related protein [Gaiellales bacterium]